MANLRAVLTVALLSFAACSDGGAAKPDAPLIHLDAAIDAVPDAPPAPDAPNYDFSCLNNTAPATATATIVLSGTAQEITNSGATPSIGPAANVSIKACTGDCLGPNLKDTQTTPAQGTFTTTAISTGGTPLDGYFDAAKTGDQRTLVYPPSPLTMTTANVPLLIFSTGTWGLVSIIAGATPDPTKGAFVVAVTDCASTPIADGVTVTVKQGGTAITGTTTFPLGQLSAMAAGAYLILNVPVGDTEVGATYMGMTLRAHVIKSIANATTETIVRPGF